MITFSGKWQATVQNELKTVLGNVMLIGGLTTIMAATLRPFTFEFHHLTWAEYIARFSLTPSSVLDFPANVLLFIPFGFGLASLLNKSGMSFGANLLFTPLMGFLLTTFIESLQIFLPNRVANVSDMVANTVGAATGMFFLLMWERRQGMAQLLKSKLVLRNVAAAFFVYLFVMGLLVWMLMRGMLPGGWDTSYRLALGNEITKGRPWRGRVHDLLVLSRAVNPEFASLILAGEIPSALDDAVVAAYPLEGETGLIDQKGGLPDLALQMNGTPEFGADGVTLGGDLWLATEMPVASLVDRINASGQFTVALTVASLDLTQSGPARILTISQDPFHRNLTLGQADTHLVLRWRSFLTGENGVTPELQFPRVFNSFEPQRIVISYDGRVASLFTARGEADQNVLLGPEVGFAAIFHEYNSWQVIAGRLAYWPVILPFSIMIFLPLGILLGIAVVSAQRRLTRVSLTGVGLILPAFLLEGIVIWYRGGELRLGTIALGITVTFTGFAIMQYWRHRRPFYSNRSLLKNPITL